jgi:Ca-activated chloride channel family protein
MRILHPEWLWLLLLLPLVALLRGRRGAAPALFFPSTGIAAAIGKSSKHRPGAWLLGLRLISITLIVLAMARPQLGKTHTEVEASGIDILLAIDLSTSMNALDFRYKGREIRRIDAVKQVVENFAQARPNDRLALLVFAAKPYLLTPLTLDHSFLLDRLAKIDTGVIEDGTAIGTALGRSLRRINDQNSKSKVVILLTDGENNAGSLSPMQAAEAAVPLGIKVYTIGAGTRGIAPIVVKDRMGRQVRVNTEVRIDEDLLTRMALATGGRYFRATDMQELEKVYQEIDTLERTTRTLQGFTLEKELFPLLLAAALLSLLLEIALKNTRLISLP